MKKITFFVASMGDGGAQRVISMLSEKLVQEFYQVEILTYYDIKPSYRIAPAVKLTCIERNTKSKNIIKNLIWLRKYIRNNCSVIVSFLAEFNMLAIVASLFLRKTIIVADRNDPRFVPENYFIRYMRDVLYGFADGVVLQTTNNKNYFSKRIQKKSKVIFNPVNLGVYKGIALNSGKVKEIVSVGRLMPQKNQVLLLKAFSLIKKERDDFHLTIYGEGSYRDELEKKVSELGLNDSVSLPGAVQDVFEKIKNAQIFVLTSDYEGMPNALIEAMCLGLPVVSTCVSGATDLINDKVNGRLLQSRSDRELANIILDLLENEKITNEMARKAVELNDKLSVDVIFSQWISFIEKSQKRKE